MKRKLLIIMISSLITTGFAQNLIKDSGFDSKVLLKGTGDPNATDGERGVWYFKTYDGVDASIVDVGGERESVAKIERAATTGFSWYRSFISQWNAEDAQPIQYKLTFKAKLENGDGLLRTHIKAPRAGESSFVLKGQEFTATYAAQKDIKLTEEWETYTIEYDFKYIVNTLYGVKEENIETAYSESTEEDLKNFFICLYPNKDNTTILIDDVTFEPIVDVTGPEPAPEEGDLLIDTDFENITSIPRRVIKNDDKYSPTMGEWYFYAEPGLNGIDESTAEIRKEEGSRGNVAVLKNGSAVPNWWGHTLMQRFSAKPKQNIYRVSFYAKSDAEATVTVMVNTKQKEGTGAEFILKEGFDPIVNSTHSGARYDIKTNNEWQYYECTFDFSQKCNNYNSPGGVGDSYAITPTNDEFLSYCYMALLNTTKESELLIDNIHIEEIDTYTEIRNPGFENNDGIPVKIQSELSPGVHSGNWVLVARSQQIGDVFITSEEAKNGEKSMQLSADFLDDRARYSFYLAMDLYEVPADEYVFKFYSKADKTEIPFRLDAYIYNGNNIQAIVGTNGESLTTEGLENSSAGLKLFETSSDWKLYTQRMTIPENSMVRFFIRPNINGLGAFGIQPESYPINYWFDDFELEVFVPGLEPAPEEGDLLIDTDFENITSIPRRVIKNDDKYSPTMGEWYFYAEPGLNGIDESTAEIRKEEGSRGNVAVLKNGSALPSWWGHTLMQRFSAKPKQNIYRVSFYAKSDAEATVSVMVNTKQAEGITAEFILKEGFDPIANSTHSGARYDIKINNEWQYYECTFDFSQKCNNYNSPGGVGDSYAVTPTDDEFLGFCYLNLLNATTNSEILIDNIHIEEIDTYTEIRNPGFENNNAIPVKLQSEPTLGTHSGNWVLVTRSQQEGEISITADEAYEGERSMFVNVENIDARARYSFYMMMDIYEVPANEYKFSFYSKADKADIPFRLDVYAYNGNNPQAIIGENGDNLTVEGTENASAGLKLYQTTTDWNLYSQQMTIPENSLIRIFIRPNINGLGAAGIAEESYPVSYWFDNFELKINKPDNIIDNSTDKIEIVSGKGYLTINNLENASLSIYDISGAVVNQYRNINSSITTSLNQGVYIIEVTEENGSVIRTKVLVK